MMPSIQEIHVFVERNYYLTYQILPQRNLNDI